MISVTNNVYKYIYNYPNMYTNDIADPTFKFFLLVFAQFKVRYFKQQTGPSPSNFH